MGLDSVILLQEVEDYFEITIPNDVAEKIVTVGDFASYVHKHITLQTAEKCKTQVLFYKVREFFCNELGLSKSEITPRTILENIVKIDIRKDVWVKLENHLALKLPKLSKVDSTGKPAIVYKFFGLKKVKSEDGLFNHTIGELISWITSLNYNTLFDKNGLCSERDVQLVLLGFVSEKLSVPIEEVKLESSFTSDLGID